MVKPTKISKTEASVEGGGLSVWLFLFKIAVFEEDALATKA